MSSIQGPAAMNHHPVKFVSAIGDRDANSGVLVETHGLREAETLSQLASLFDDDDDVYYSRGRRPRENE